MSFLFIFDLIVSLIRKTILVKFIKSSFDSLKHKATLALNKLLGFLKTWKLVEVSTILLLMQEDRTAVDKDL